MVVEIRVVGRTAHNQPIKPTPKSGAAYGRRDAAKLVRPSNGCLWCNQLIDPTQLALEAKSDAERKAQAYGTAEPNPSVITLNAVAAAHAVNDFLFDYLGLRQDSTALHYEHFHFLRPTPHKILPRKDPHCSECGREAASRFARGDGRSLPCIDG